MPVLCRIVAEPERDAPIRFDFHPGVAVGAWLNDRRDGFSLGEPEFSIAHDGSFVEGERDIRLTYMEARSRAEAETALGACARALTDPAGSWLLWQVDEHSTPTFFKLHPSSPGALDFRWVNARDDDQRVWRWDIKIKADAFAYGERRSFEQKVTYGLGGSTYRLPDPTGDVPTRARVEITQGFEDVDANGWPITDTDMFGCTPMVNTAAFPVGAVPESGLVRWEAEHFTPGPNYTYSTDNLSAGSSLSRTGTQSGISCLDSVNSSYLGGLCFSGKAPNKVPPGTYRTYLRIVNMATTPTRPAFRVSAQGWGASSSTYWSTWFCPTASGPSSAYAYGSWLDCGSLQIPVGMDPANLTIDEIDPPVISVHHRGGGSGGRVVVDQVLLVPADPVNGSAATLRIAWLNNTGPNVFGPMTIDDRSYRVGNVDELSEPGNAKWRSEAAPRVVGGFPVLAPERDNWLTFLWNVQRINNGQNPTTYDPKDVELTLKVSWSPRYIHLGSL